MPLTTILLLLFEHVLDFSEILTDSKKQFNSKNVVRQYIH